jgi:hypothetical protein
VGSPRELHESANDLVESVDDRLVERLQDPVGHRELETRERLARRSERLVVAQLSVALAAVRPLGEPEGKRARG